VTFKTLFASIVVASVAMPMAAQAQGVPGGIANGWYQGGMIAGPVGAVVGGAVGGVIGGVEGVLGINHTYGVPAPVYQQPAQVRKKRKVRRQAQRTRVVR
jgi:hypothetical protein